MLMKHVRRACMFFMLNLCFLIHSSNSHQGFWFLSTASPNIIFFNIIIIFYFLYHYLISLLHIICMYYANYYKFRNYNCYYFNDITIINNILLCVLLIALYKHSNHLYNWWTLPSLPHFLGTVTINLLLVTPVCKWSFMVNSDQLDSFQGNLRKGKKS